MHIKDYPQQEPLTEVGEAYQTEALRLSEGIEGQEFRYGTSDPSQGILVFPAERPNGIVFAFMHGGGWTNGFKEMMAFIAPVMNAAGITYASMGYRLAPRYTFPAGWLDAARGTGWLYHNIEKFGGNSEKLFVGGHSAGGHYAALLSTRRDWQNQVGVPESVLKGALPISGTYWFGETSGLSMRPRFLGPVEQRNEIYASPMEYLNETPVPIFLAHGSEDFPHLMVQAEKFEGAVRGAGGEVERVVLPGRTHFTSCYAAGESDGPWAPRAIAWMKEMSRAGVPGDPER